MSKEELATRRISRKRLLKRAGVGGAVLLATPVMASTASAQRLPRFTCRDGGCGVDCEVGGNPCGGQTNCTNPDERFCTCLCRTAGPNNPAGRCFCHEPSSCGDLPPCTRQADCPADWACAASCCSYDASQKFCHPPCGTTTGAGALSGRTSVGTL
jgi:hypothetical protein